jgi:acetolactate synthase-1/2/3 large subunit
MQVVDFIAHALKREGVEYLFCYPTTPMIDAAARAGIRPMLCRQERVGVDMANGYARVRDGKPFGVFAMQYGPGAENAFPGVATAFSDSAPVLLLPLGQRREVAKVPPTFSSTRAYAPVARSVEELLLPEEIGNVMRRAFSHLKNGRLGPVLVEVPLDLIEADASPDRSRVAPVQAVRSCGDARDVDAAADALLGARQPMIQAGQGIFYADACGELLELAELAQVPVISTVEGKSAFPETHPLSLGTSGNVLTAQGAWMLETADVIFAIGTSLSRHNLTNRVWPVAQKRVIHATNDPRDLYKGYETDVAILGDAKLILRQIIDSVTDRLRRKPRKSDVIDQIAVRKAAWRRQWRAKLESDAVPITPYRVISEFNKAIPADEAIVTHDSGSPRDQMLPFYESGVPHSYLGWGKSHALGTGLGLTIGAKVAAPEKFCVNFMGDAAFGMTGLDFETSVRLGAPICTVVLNNSTMAIETDHMTLSHSMYRTRDIGGNYAGIARELGGWSERVEHPGQLKEAFLRAREQTENGRAALLEIITSEEVEFSFRHDNFTTNH